MRLVKKCWVIDKFWKVGRSILENRSILILLQDFSNFLQLKDKYDFVQDFGLQA